MKPREQVSARLVHHKPPASSREVLAPNPQTPLEGLCREPQPRCSATPCSYPLPERAAAHRLPSVLCVELFKYAWTRHVVWIRICPLGGSQCLYNVSRVDREGLTDWGREREAGRGSTAPGIEAQVGNTGKLLPSLPALFASVKGVLVPRGGGRCPWVPGVRVPKQPAP